MTRRHLLIGGRVQGVFYRAWFVERARALGLAGWVRNLTDGRVEALIAGDDAAVAAMVAAAHDGPAAARVTEVAVTVDTSTDDLTGFTKRPDA